MTVSETARGVREFSLPDVGEGLTEAELVTWHVRPGEQVADGQLVCEIETAKALVELPIPFDGVVSELRAAEGETVRVGTVIITVDTGTGDAVALPATAEAEPAAGEPGPEQRRQPVLVGYGVATSSGTRRSRKKGGAVPVATGGERVVRSRALAKPPVRKLAKDLGIDLTTVIPTGLDGVITRDDVRAAGTTVTAAQSPAVTASPGGTEPVAGSRREPIRGVRKATAASMVASAFTAPHVTEFITVDVTRTMKLVRELKNDAAFAGLRVTPLLLAAKALLVAIRRNPEVNASWDEQAQEIVYYEDVNLGVAAATPRGLVVPNIKRANDLTLPGLASALGELVATAREGKTTPAAMRGGTVTVTNIGVFGVDTGTPLLNPGESAILAFGAVKERPWVHRGAVRPRQVTTLALSFDHRLVDGELGSKVLADTAAILERPKRLATWS